MVARIITSGPFTGDTRTLLDEILFGVNDTTDLICVAGTTTCAGLQEFRDVRVDAGAILEATTGTETPLIIRARRRITINGVLRADGLLTTRTPRGVLGTSMFSTGGGGGGGGGGAVAGTGKDGENAGPNLDAGAFAHQLSRLSPPPTNGYDPPTAPVGYGTGGLKGGIGFAGNPGTAGSAGVAGAVHTAELWALFSAFPLVMPPAGGGAGLLGVDGGAGGAGGTDGGAGGAGGARGTGGAGGKGGGTIVLCAPEIIIGAAAVIIALGVAGAVGTAGANGGNGVAPNAGGGGSGGGGAGGQGGNGGCILVYGRTITDASAGAAFVVTGGTGGAGGAAGAVGLGSGTGKNGGLGAAGANGPAGSVGVVVIREISG